MRLDLAGASVQVATGGRSLDGNDPLVVLVHGAAVNRSVWYQQTRFLAHNGFRAVAPDLPGHGGTPGPPLGTIDDMADWLARVVADLGGTAHLVGHSMGALVALDTAARHPDVVRSLVLFGVGAAMPVHPDLQAAADRDADVADELVAAWSHGPAQHVGHNPNPGLWMIGGAVSLLHTAADGVLASDLAACSAFDQAPDRLAEVSCRITVVAGADDRMTPPRATDALVAAVPSAHLVTVADAGHMAMQEAPAASRDVLVAHLAAAESELS